MTTPRVTDPVAPPDVLENEDDEINTPLLPTSTTFLSQELVVCTGVSSNPHYMEGFPIDYYSRFGYCFNEEEQIWRSSKCTHAKVVKGKGKINRCQPCAIRAKNRSRLSHEGIDSSQQLRILLQTDVNKGRRIADDDARRVYFKSFFTSNPTAGAFNYGNQKIGACQGFACESKKISGHHVNLNGSYRSQHCELYCVKKTSKDIVCVNCVKLCRATKKNDLVYQRNRHFSPSDKKHPSNPSSTTNLCSLTESDTKRRFASLSGLLKSKNRSLVTALKQLKDGGHKQLRNSRIKQPAADKLISYLRVRHHSHSVQWGMLRAAS